MSHRAARYSGDTIKMLRPNDRIDMPGYYRRCRCPEKGQEPKDDAAATARRPL